MQGSIDFSGVLSGAISGEGGGGAVPVVTANATVDANTGTPSCDVVRTGTDLNPNFTFNFKNIKGATGSAGEPGTNGTNGTDGVSPGVTISNITNGHRVTITDATHPSGQVFDVMNGANGTDGTNGTNGTDGVSPYVTITNITDGHRVNITDATHPQGQTFDVMNGEKGDTGNTGATGPAGPGVPSGGDTGQILYKSSSSDYHTEWGDIPSYSASTITYDPTGRSYISDTDVQGALDEVDGALGTINASLTNLETRLPTDTNWTTLGSGSCKYCKCNGIVFIIINSVSASARSWTTIGNLPTGFRPTTQINFAVAGGDHREYSAICQIGTSTGEVRIYCNTSANYWGFVSFPTID